MRIGNLSRTCCALVIALALVMVEGCATARRDFETPQGSRSGDQFGPWIVLGVLNRSTSSLNQPSAYNVWEEQITVDVPVGTQIIVPVMRGWVLGAGSATPPDTSLGSAKWNSDDHNYGVAYTDISIVDINAPDLATNTQTARIKVELWLADYNGDDPWFGRVNYTLICLGPHP